MPLVHCAQYFLLAALTVLATGTLTSAFLVKVSRNRILRQEPSQRHRTLVLLAMLPGLAMVILLLAACLPSLISLGLPAFDHCPNHDDGHPHLCFVHLPAVGINRVLVLGLLVAAIYVVSRVSMAAAGMRRATQIYQTLARLGERRDDLGVIVLDTTQPVCLAAGLFNPRVLLSRGLLETLSPEERAVILAHEAAHVCRHDALVMMLARVGAALHVPGVARWLVRELEIAAEQVCDETASRAVGDRTLVASTILSVERAVRQSIGYPLSPIAVAFGQCAVERRVESLLGEPPPRERLCAIATAIIAANLVVLACADQLHHVTESLLSIVLH